jgi:hypothetical protein
MKSAYDLVGTLASPRNKLGYHAKKSSVGTATAAFHKCESESRKAGSIVDAGNGQSIVGTPETSTPIEAGISNPKPVANVRAAFFDAVFTKNSPRNEELRRAPELRSGCNEHDADASLAARTLADVNDAALLFGLIVHVGQEQPLAARHQCFQYQRTSVVVRVNGFGLFVEWLLVRVGTIDQQGDVVRVAQASAAVGVLLCLNAGAICRRVAILPAGPQAFGLS